MNRAYVLTLSVAILLPCVLSAADETTAREPMDAKDLPGKYTLRDPFWPIDYKPKVEVKKDPSQPKEPEAPKAFVPKWPELRIKSITESSKGYFAIVDKVGIVEQGQIIRIASDGALYTWRVEKISKKGFLAKPLEAKPKK